MRVLELSPEYECHVLWIYEDGDLEDNPGADELPLSPQLTQRINAWESRYNATLDLDNPKNSGFVDMAEEQAFIQEGLEIAQQLQAELGAEYQVIYQNQPVGLSPASRK